MPLESQSAFDYLVKNSYHWPTMYFENKSNPHTIVIIIITRDPVDFIQP